jgi:trehalose 6-phosphate synthase/phosphatase
MACPIAIDHSAFVHRSRHPAVLTQAAGMQGVTTGPLFVGVDRLDYTKGIPERLLAFERLLHFEPGLRGQARFIQIAVPTRHGVAGYDEVRASVAALVARINAVHGTANWTPVEYVCGSVDRNSLVALYRAATVMVVTPKADGMNLVAKEFVASRTDGRGVLVLSRTAGAAEELRAAVLVDPHDVSSIMEGYRRAIRMSAVERRSRMRTLRKIVLSRDVFVWAHQLLTAVAEPARFEQHAGPATIGSYGGESTRASGLL